MKHTLIIAEAGVNHNGSLDLAKQLVDKAAEAGAEVLVVEKLGLMGGSTLMSGGMIHAWGTDEQAEYTGTTDDNADLMFNYYKGCGGTYIDDEVCYDMCEGSHDDFRWCNPCFQGDAQCS